MWSIIKSHFHKGKTGFIITGLFVTLSVLMMIVGLSICFGIGGLYKNTQKITNSPDYNVCNYKNNDVFDGLMTEIVKEFGDKIDLVNKHNAIRFRSSSDKLDDFLEVQFGNGGNIGWSAYDMRNMDDKDNQYLPRVRDKVDGEGFKLYVSGNVIATTKIRVGHTAYFRYNGEKYKGYVAGVYDSMPLIYSADVFVDGEFYNFVESLVATDDDFGISKSYNVIFNYKTEKECEQICNDFTSAIMKKTNDYNLLQFDDEQKITCSMYHKYIFVNATKSFILILGTALIAFAVLVAAIVAIVLAFLVRSSIMDEVRNLGIWKSLGYTTMMLRLSYLAIYGVISSVCMAVGIILGVSLMPVFVNVITALARIDCTKAIGFNAGSIFVAIALICAVISAVVMLATGKIKRITTLSAMRNNIETHSFKRNLAPLAKSKVPVNATLGVKSVVGETGRSVMVVAIVLLMSFLCAFVSVAFYNLKVDQTAIINMSAYEVPDWIIGFDYDDNEPYFDALRKMDGYLDDKLIINSGCYVNDKFANGIYYEDFDNLRTKLPYEGRLPKHKNEIMLEVSYAKDNNYNIGDTVVFEYNVSEFLEPVSYNMVVVGYFQSISSLGKYICFLDSFDEYKEFWGDLSHVARYWYFEKGKCPTSYDISGYLYDTFDVADDDYIRFRGFMSGRSRIDSAFLSTVETAADAVMSVFMSVTALIISLLLVMLIKLKLLREKRDYAIYKALGYTTPNIMTQIAIEMVILGVIGSLVGAIVGALVTTPLLSLVGGIIGVGKFAFIIPWGYIVAIMFGIPLLAYLVSMLCAIPVRKIAPATLLRERG